MARSFSFQGISPLSPNSEVVAGASIYDEGLYLQPIESRSGLSRSESGTTLAASVTMDRPSSPDSLRSYDSSLYAQIMDSSYEKRRVAAAAGKQSPQRATHKRKSREFRRGGPPPPDSDSSVCDENWERRSLPPGRRSVSVDTAERVKFASLRKPTKQKGKHRTSKDLIFVPSPSAKRLPSEADTVSLSSEPPRQPIAASSPHKTGSVPSSPMVGSRTTTFQRSSSLVDESEIHAVKTTLRHVTNAPSAQQQQQQQQKTPNGVDASVAGTDTSSLWQVTPDSSISSVLSAAKTPAPAPADRTVSPPTAPAELNSSVSTTLSTATDTTLNGDELNNSADAVYENIPADEETPVYGKGQAPAPEPAVQPPQPRPAAPGPKKSAPVKKPAVSAKPKSKERKKSDESQKSSDSISIRVSPNQTLTIRSNPSSPQEIRENMENERLPENLRLKINATETDSDDTFFDDASFDTLSECSQGNRLKSPPKVSEHRPSIADQLKKVVSDPKLKEWLAEQASRAQERQAAVGGKEEERIDFGKDTEDSTIKKNPNAKNKSPKTAKSTKTAPNPKPRNLTDRGKPKEVKPRPTEPPPPPPDESDDSFDDGSFDTLEDSEELAEEVEAPTTHNDSVQYETMNNLNNPGKPIPTPRKAPSRSDAGSSRGSQELLNWERVDPGGGNDSYYWEHTGTEEFLEAKAMHSPPPQGSQSRPVHKLLPEAEYMQMQGLVKGQQSAQGTAGQRTSTFRSPPTSPTTPQSAKLKLSDDHTDNNQNLVSPTGSAGSRGSVFVSIPGQGDFTDILRKPIQRQVSDDYEFHKQQLDMNTASPVNIESRIEQRLSRENLSELDHAPRNLGLPIVNLDHSPNSKATQRQQQQLRRGSSNRGNQRVSQSSDSSTSVTHVPGPKHADQMYAVVSKSMKRNPSDASNVSSVSTSHKAVNGFDAAAQPEGATERSPTFSTGPMETSSEVNQKQEARIPPHVYSREGIYEELPLEESPRRRVTIGTEQIIFPDDPDRKSRDHDHREIRYDSRGKPRISIVGGNADGIYIHRIDPGSDAEQQGLMEGDQILKINNQSINGMTKEEVTLMLLSLPHVVTLTVRYKRDRYDHIAANAGMGDSFYVRANFSYEPTTKGEIRIQEGDVLSVRDTLPDGQVGSWRALKVNARPNEIQHGLVPNEGRAEQVALAQKRVQQTRERSLEREPKPGFLRRSFRRSKSAERLNKENDAFQREQARPDSGVKKPAYERVEQRPPGFLRPVAIVGLFCDTVRDRLAQDCPGIFERAPPEVEIPTSKEEGDTKDPINLKIIHSIIDRRKHCLMIVSPRAIQYLLHTQLHPIVIYLHPGSKAVIKALRGQLAPRFEKRSAFMYEEAVQFEKTYSHLFTATVTYTTDDTWFTLLKDTITRIQNQPLWQLAPKVVPNSAEASPQSLRGQDTQVPNQRAPQQNSRPLPRGRALTRQIPPAVQNVMNRRGSGSGPRPQNGLDLDSSIASVESVDSVAARYRNKPMTLTYDGYFLSGGGSEDAQSTSSSQSQPGAVNGQARITEIPDAQGGRPKGILKRPSGGSVHSTGAPSDYESDISFSGDPMHPRRSGGMVNGFPPRNDLVVQRVQQSPVVRKQRGFVGNGAAPPLVTSSPAMHRPPPQQQQQQQQQKWGKQHPPIQEPHQPTRPQAQVSAIQCFRFRIGKNWPLLMRTVLGDLLSDQEIIEALIDDLRGKPMAELEEHLTNLIELWINFRWPSFTGDDHAPTR